MSKKIFFAQDWENVPSEIKQTDIPSITSLYNKVEEDVEHVVWEIEQRAIDIAPNYKDWVELGFALVDGLGETDGSIITALVGFIFTIKGKRQTNNTRIVCNPKDKVLPFVLSSIWQTKPESRWLHSAKNIYPFFQISKIEKRVNG